jgi:para-nitrobenzyl esterase
VAGQDRQVLTVLRKAVTLCGAALLLWTSGIWAAPMIRIPGDPVSTSGGLVAGTHLPSGVHAYLGVPYAQPPVRNLRWKPPQPIRWQGVWNADHMGPECIQVLRQHDINHYFGEEASSEDCLYLNIWAPTPAKPRTALPVIVFIYGGGGTIGSAAMAHYNGESIARHGAIFVDLNYRLGILGFMAHPELTREQGGHSGDYGFLDQNAALKWIHDNIAAFGGDPDKVLLIGQSFGASSVVAQIMSPLSKGLFRAAMMSSSCSFGGSIAGQAAVALTEGEKIGLDVQKRLGATDLAALRNVAADRILAQQAETQLLLNNPGVKVPPVIDGYFWTGDKQRTLASHAGSDVPIIAGSNGDDNDSERSALTHTHTVTEYQAIAQQMYGTNADEFLRLYPVSSDADVQLMAHRAAIEGGYLEVSRTCGELQARYNHSPTYIDLFVRKHSYTPGVKIADQDPVTVGAYHNADIPFWFGTLDSFNLFRSTRTWTPADRALSERMMQSLIAFARSGSPDTADVHWPTWTEAAPQYLEIEGDLSTVRSMDLPKMDWLAAHPAAAVSSPAPQRVGPRD